MFLLDTNILSEIINRPNGRVAAHAERVGEHLLVTSIVVACELRYGVAKRGSEVLRRKVDGVLDRMAILALDGSADEHYANLRADLERRGLPIGANDMLIAAHALAVDATLVTDNVGEFSRISNLTIENWLRD